MGALEMGTMVGEAVDTFLIFQQTREAHNGKQHLLNVGGFFFQL